ncbi:MAG: glutamate-5-semialdehyde dehydrogenase [Flammeovirgaceae bacterium]|nr:glutamate-5-semialdehyde dehydrogenase [Flammeovirgaceae bacterium]MDW8286808.1 glutamate-5-semialdehyde dehydrogenase [Flammeovirgaceae bacterium]
MNTYLPVFEAVKKASETIVLLEEKQIHRLLLQLADRILEKSATILAANEKDLARMDVKNPKYDRLLLNEKRLQGIAQDIRNVAHLPSPLGKVLMQKTMPNGLEISKITVPLGVVGVIYEARPNVTLDVFSLCFKSGNACILKGGSDAEASNQAIVEVIRTVLDEQGISPDVVALLPSDRAAADALMNAIGYVEVIIPRGSQTLIDAVRQNAKVPVIETGAGIVHTFVDESADLEKSKKVILNAKTRRVSVCNALDCLILHEKRLPELAQLVAPLAEHHVELFADEPAYVALQGKYPSELLQKAQPQHFGTEFLAYKMAIKTVATLDDALAHIRRYSSRHSEAILSENQENIEKFFKVVDAAALYANTSTAFTDGAQFGLGAEIGISTQKLHARGPMGLAELTSYKWIVRGNGQVRPA